LISVNRALWGAAQIGAGRFTWILYKAVSIWGRPRPEQQGGTFSKFDGEKRMSGLVDVLVPADGLASAEALGLKVHRSVATGTRIRQIPRDEAEIPIECLRDLDILESASPDQSAPENRVWPAE
jgi:hypothetical protein